VGLFTVRRNTEKSVRQSLSISFVVKVKAVPSRKLLGIPRIFEGRGKKSIKIHPSRPGISASLRKQKKRDNTEDERKLAAA